MRALIAILLFAVSFAANAQSGRDALLEWVLPTEHADGTPLDPSIHLDPNEGIRIYHCTDTPCALQSSNEVLAQTAPGTNTMAFAPDLPFGENMFFVTAVHVNGNESQMSNTDLLVVTDDRVPNPPSLGQVTLAAAVGVIRLCDSGNIPTELAQACNLLALAVE